MNFQPSQIGFGVDFDENKSSKYDFVELGNCLCHRRHQRVDSGQRAAKPYEIRFPKEVIRSRLLDGLFRSTKVKRFQGLNSTSTLCASYSYYNFVASYRL